MTTEKGDDEISDDEAKAIIAAGDEPIGDKPIKGVMVFSLGELLAGKGPPGLKEALLAAAPPPAAVGRAVAGAGLANVGDERRPVCACFQTHGHRDEAIDLFGTETARAFNKKFINGADRDSLCLGAFDYAAGAVMAAIVVGIGTEITKEIGPLVLAEETTAEVMLDAIDNSARHARERIKLIHLAAKNAKAGMGK